MVSSKQILCGTSLYEVRISVNNTEAWISQVNGNHLYVLKASTISELKRRIKNILEQLGATFAQEIRNKGETKKL